MFLPFSCFSLFLHLLLVVRLTQFIVWIRATLWEQPELGIGGAQNPRFTDCLGFSLLYSNTSTSAKRWPPHTDCRHTHPPSPAHIHTQEQTTASASCLSGVSLRRVWPLPHPMEARRGEGAGFLRSQAGAPLPRSLSCEPLFPA